MAELGESISPPAVIQDEAHTVQNCPWHDNGEQPPDPPPMDPQADDEDAAAGFALKPIPANSGKKLGENKGGKDNTEIKVSYPGSASPKPEPLQWAPHHLIPGNASLKGSQIVPYLGDDNVIAKYGKGSKIKPKQSVGYDVNCSENGVWLPSPYALSMKGKWPTNPAAKLAYVEAAIDQSGGNAQFHMSHWKQMNKYFILRYEAEGPVVILNSLEGTSDRADSWMLGRSFRGPVSTPVRVTAKEDFETGLLVPIYPTPTIMRRDLYDAIRASGVDNIDVWPAVVYSSSGEVISEEYVAYNIIGLVAAAGLGTKYSPDNPERLMTASIDSLEIDPNAARELLMFRLAESLRTIVVHERVKSEIEARGIQNVAFVDPGDHWT